jgi:mRNA-degrading endonuclease RelE of RelBE toxin-antitoxin system
MQSWKSWSGINKAHIIQRGGVANSNPMGYVHRHAVVAKTPIFTRQTEKLFTEEERQLLIDFLAENPLAGDEIPGTGGVRKLRYAASGRGKRGGARIIYYYLDDTLPLYALLAYAKNDQGDMTPDEKRAVSALAAALKATRKETR